MVDVFFPILTDSFDVFQHSECKKERSANKKKGLLNLPRIELTAFEFYFSSIHTDTFRARLGNHSEFIKNWFYLFLRQTEQPSRPKIFPFVQYSLIHDLALNQLFRSFSLLLFNQPFCKTNLKWFVCQQTSGVCAMAWIYSIFKKIITTNI